MEDRKHIQGIPQFLLKREQRQLREKWIAQKFQDAVRLFKFTLLKSYTNKSEHIRLSE